ncbi:MAG: hypothetical protein IT548_12725 [Alphaproteobacteria bacterium]|nr:hypothetical protein [Alphaproteobacteria bacterium]
MRSGLAAACGVAFALVTAGPAFAQVLEDPPATLKAGDYECATRGGRVLPERGFTIVDDSHYITPTSQGLYEIKGVRVFFDLGDLDGKQIRILPKGKLKYSERIMCTFAGDAHDFIPETPQPSDGTPPASPPEGQPTADPQAQPNSQPALPAGTAPPADAATPPPAKPADQPAAKVIKIDPAQPADDPHLVKVPPS